MPAVSRAQFGFMGAVAAGKARKPTSLTRGQAREYIRGQSPKGLPAHAKARRATRLQDVYPRNRYR
jgi:hypothetical protein